MALAESGRMWLINKCSSSRFEATRYKGRLVAFFSSLAVAISTRESEVMRYSKGHKRSEQGINWPQEDGVMTRFSWLFFMTQQPQTT